MTFTEILPLMKAGKTAFINNYPSNHYFIDERNNGYTQNKQRKEFATWDYKDPDPYHINATNWEILGEFSY
jgi:hypothetical protein